MPAGNVQRADLPARRDLARVPEGALGGHVDRLGDDQHAVRRLVGQQNGARRGAQPAAEPPVVAVDGEET